MTSKLTKKVPTSKDKIPRRNRFLPPHLGIVAGQTHSIAIKQDGSVWSWGQNKYGQLGDGTITDKLTSVRINGIEDIEEVAAGYSHSLALRHSDSTLWAWGNNDNGQCDGLSSTNESPVLISGISNVWAIAAGHFYTLVLKKDTTVWGFGGNNSGQLGNGTSLDQKNPVQAIGMNLVLEIAAGATHSLARKDDGTVWGWGNNLNDQLGLGVDFHNVNQLFPVQIPKLSRITAISAGFNISMALNSDGKVYCAGSRGSAMEPYLVNSLSDIIKISAGFDHYLALKSDGTVWAWGGNTYGQLGDGTTSPINRFDAVKVSGLDNVIYIDAGFYYSFAIKKGLGNQYSVWAWGKNDVGQFGNGTLNNSTTPVQINWVP